MQANGKLKQEFPTKTHERSGYTWGREEDAPGYAWMNKKALDEFHRAWDSLVHKDFMVKGELNCWWRVVLGYELIWIVREVWWRSL